MKRRGVADGKLPDELVHYCETDWVRGPVTVGPAQTHPRTPTNSRGDAR